MITRKERWWEEHQDLKHEQFLEKMDNRNQEKEDENKSETEKDNDEHEGRDSSDAD